MWSNLNSSLIILHYEATPPHWLTHFYRFFSTSRYLTPILKLQRMTSTFQEMADKLTLFVVIFQNIVLWTLESKAARQTLDKWKNVVDTIVITQLFTISYRSLSKRIPKSENILSSSTYLQERGRRSRLGWHIKHAP